MTKIHTDEFPVNQGIFTELAPRIILRLWYETLRDQEFGVPPLMYTNVESWAHEFTELAIWFVIYNNHNICTNQLNNAVCIKLKNGKIRKYTMPHILTSLHTTSYDKFGRQNPEDYGRGARRLAADREQETEGPPRARARRGRQDRGGRKDRREEDAILASLVRLFVHALLRATIPKQMTFL